MLTLVRSLGLAVLSLLFAACSTALLVDTPFDDDPQPDASLAPDSGTPRDASLPRDSGPTRPDGSATLDASASSDAGAVSDAGPAPNPSFPRDCRRELPSAGFTNLLIDDCSTRPRLMCASQTDLDAQFARLAGPCRVPRNATVGVQLSPSGCPELLTYDQRSVQGEASLCLQTVLESLRLSCGGRCALLRAP